MESTNLQITHLESEWATFLIPVCAEIKPRRQVGRVCGTHGRGRCTRFLVRKPEGKRPLGRRRRRLQGEVRIDLKDVSWRGVEWIQLTQDRYPWR
jgi:hypothetical protein